MVTIEIPTGICKTKEVVHKWANELNYQWCHGELDRTEVLWSPVQKFHIPQVYTCLLVHIMKFIITGDPMANDYHWHTILFCTPPIKWHPHFQLYKLFLSHCLLTSGCNATYLSHLHRIPIMCIAIYLPLCDNLQYVHLRPSLSFLPFNHPFLEHVLCYHCAQHMAHTTKQCPLRCSDGTPILPHHIHELAPLITDKDIMTPEIFSHVVHRCTFTTSPSGRSLSLHIIVRRKISTPI